MIQIQKNALSALKNTLLSLGDIPKRSGFIGHMLAQELLRKLHNLPVVVKAALGQILRANEGIVGVAEKAHFFFETFLEQISYTQTTTVHFCGVGGANALACGADTLFAAFASRIQSNVNGERDVRTIIDAQTVALESRTRLGNLLKFFFEGHGIEHASRANVVFHVGVENAGGHRVCDQLLPVQPQGVARVGSAVKPDDPFGLSREGIRDLAFAFVAVLES